MRGRVMRFPNWIPVAERLPDADILVLIALSDGEVWPGFLDGDTWRYAEAMPIERDHVTHWMGLPEHPQAAKSRESAPGGH